MGVFTSTTIPRIAAIIMHFSDQVGGALSQMALNQQQEPDYLLVAWPCTTPDQRDTSTSLAIREV